MRTRRLQPPDPYFSREQFLRYHHQDLAAMSEQELEKEIRRALVAASLAPVLSWATWWEQRYQAALAERTRRKGGGHERR
ncbi:hypothetical protein EG19_10920 [Thermoanaerobaculum aquaticum]|uniref:Uncharacterized protein n=1 Tax=Thermoanaerobaculum aquaticum TaxID=1312852 RepID=A0A062XPG9_9BACT|nr:hypothetical protein EG19_10920 [Thermoanaerobaculum aquaticum]